MYARVASINLQFMRGVGKMGGLTVNCRVEKRYNPYVGVEMLQGWIEGISNRNF